MRSLWTNTAALPHFEELKTDLNCDVLIVGGGLTGILCAYYLSAAGVDYALAEADTLCSGITKNTTAKLTSQHGLIYDQLIREFGTERARSYYDANEAALLEYRRLCKGIDCDYQIQDSFVYSVRSDSRLKKEWSALQRLGIPAIYQESLPLPFPVTGAIGFSGQASFHPLKFAAALVPGLKIYEHTKIMELEENGHLARTAKHKIHTKKLILTTHYPMLNKHGLFFMKLFQQRSYVLALQNAPLVNGMYVDEQESGLSFRSADNLLLLGGGSHRTGKCGGWPVLEHFAALNYPEAQEQYRWATQDCMSLDKVPYIGVYSPRTPDLFTATGYNKWGMTSSMAAARLLTDLVQERHSPYEALFSPSRSLLRPQLAVNLAESAVHLLKPSKMRCPHMGCALEWNPLEYSWDCPCHGSRFTKTGQLIDNPSTDDLKQK